MATQQIWANLPVEDPTRSAGFYSQLGFEPNGEATAEIASFLFAGNRFIIHFFRRDKLEASMGGKATNTDHGNEVIFSLSAESEDEVKAWADKAGAAGGSVVKEARRHSDGYYYCVFADPDGHKFNALLMEQGM